MITKEICAAIWHCYTEIESGNKMIEELKKRMDEKGELDLPGGWDGSYKRTLELHIPSNGGGHHIKRLPFDLALAAITRHIEDQGKELIRLKEVCKLQLM